MGVVVRETGYGAGKGIYAARDFRKGERVFRFTGDVVDWKGCTHRSLQVGRNRWIRPGSRDLGGWLNHSCAPNCAVRETDWITALRPIRKGEEITIDYSFTDGTQRWDMECLCGAKACRKRLVSYAKLPRTIKETHRERTSEYLLAGN